jgi:hypothetical protein
MDLSSSGLDSVEVVKRDETHGTDMDSKPASLPLKNERLPSAGLRKIRIPSPNYGFAESSSNDQEYKPLVGQKCGRSAKELLGLGRKIAGGPGESAAQIPEGSKADTALERKRLFLGIKQLKLSSSESDSWGKDNCNGTNPPVKASSSTGSHDLRTLPVDKDLRPEAIRHDREKIIPTHSSRDDKDDELPSRQSPRTKPPVEWPPKWEFPKELSKRFDVRPFYQRLQEEFSLSTLRDLI